MHCYSREDGAFVRDKTGGMDAGDVLLVWRTNAEVNIHARRLFLEIGEVLGQHDRNRAPNHLLSPRVLAGFLMTPFLMIFSFFFAIFSAQLLVSLSFDVSAISFYNSMRALFRTQDVIIGIVKGFVFGGSIALSGCYYGFFTQGGAVGVGEATKKAVVAASILILFFNVVINLIMM